MENKKGDKNKNEKSDNYYQNDSNQNEYYDNTGGGHFYYNRKKYADGGNIKKSYTSQNKNKSFPAFDKLVAALFPK